MELTISGVYEFVPKFNGNRKLKGENQIVVTYRYMTSEEEERFTHIVPRYSSKDSDKVEVDVKTNANDIWDACVIKIVGLKDKATGNPITDPKKVREIKGIYALITEVVAEIKKGFTEAELKN